MVVAERRAMSSASGLRFWRFAPLLADCPELKNRGSVVASNRALPNRMGLSESKRPQRSVHDG
jgi:hypothetical protein